MEKQFKTTYKYFSISQWMDEENYLREMHKNGWELISVFMGFYRFISCTPEDVIYKLDYNSEGIKNHDEYIQMFSDCGWNYVLDYVGYSYFRKPVKDGVNAEAEDIFCDDDSRLEMIKRVFKGRVVPLFGLFFCIVIPQLCMNSMKNQMFNKVMTGFFSIMFVVYLAIFIRFGYEYLKAKKRLGR